MRNVLAVSVVVVGGRSGGRLRCNSAGTADRVAERGRFEGDFAGLQPLVQPKTCSLRS